MQKAQLRVMLVGDPKQLPSIGAGGMLEHIAGRTNHCKLTELRRTRHEHLQQVQLCIREGNSYDALQIMNDNHLLHLGDTNEESMRDMVQAWNTNRSTGGVDSSLMIVHTSNHDVDHVNLLAQGKRIEAGELTGRGVKAPDRDYLLFAGDIVEFRTRAYHVGNDQRRVENGTRGIITRTNSSRNTAHVKITEPVYGTRTVEVDLNECTALRLGYASHVFPSQGTTYDFTYELTGGSSVNNNSAYVSASRVRHSHEMFTSRDILGIGMTDDERLRILADKMNESTMQKAALTFTKAQTITRAKPIQHTKLHQDVTRQQLTL